MNMREVTCALGGTVELPARGSALGVPKSSCCYSPICLYWAVHSETKLKPARESSASRALLESYCCLWSTCALLGSSLFSPFILKLIHFEFKFLFWIVISIFIGFSQALSNICQENLPWQVWHRPLGCIYESCFNSYGEGCMTDQLQYFLHAVVPTIDYFSSELFENSSKLNK